MSAERVRRAAIGLGAGMLLLVCVPGAAQAAACVSTASGPWGTAATWSGCGGGVPGAGDTATIDTSDQVTLDADRSVAALTIASSGQLLLSGGFTVVAGSATLVEGALRGPGVVRVTGAFAKTSASQFAVQDDADLVLQGAAQHIDGPICLNDNGGGLPSLQIDGVFTLAASIATDTPFNCGANGAALRVGAAGQLIDQRAGTTFSNSSIDNDGLVSARADGLQFSGGGGGATSTGTWEAQAGDTLRLQGTFNLSGGAMTGAGAVQIAGTVNAATTGVDPAVLDLNSGALVLTGVGTYAPQVLRVSGGGVATTRNVAPAVLDARSGFLRGDHTVTPGSFTKTTGGQLAVQDGADVVIGAAATHSDGPICLNDIGGGLPSLQIDGVFTLAASIATDTPFNCGANGATVRVGAAGQLIDQRAGTTFSNSSIDNDGLVSARADGLQFSGGGGGATSTGTWEAQAGDTLRLQGTFDLSGGAMTGAGVVQIAGTVNAAGTGVNPAVLDLNSGALVLTGVGTYAPQTLRVSGGGVATTRNVAPAVLDARSGFLRGNHTVTPGSFTKTTGGQLAVQDGADVVIGAAATHADGPICLNDIGGGLPSLQIDGVFTLAASIATDTPFNCGANGATLRVGAAGQLIDQRAGTTFSNSSIDNDGLVSARADGLQFSGGGGGATSTGTWEAQAGDTLRLQGTFDLSGGAMTGAGVVQIAGTVNAAGTGVNPAVLDLDSGALVLTGVGAYAPQTLRVSGGGVATTRNVAPAVLDARSGFLRGNHTITPGSFTKTTGGQLAVQDGADVVIGAPATHADGPICLNDNGGGLPSLQINAAYTLAASIATDTPFNCGANGPTVRVGAAGQLIDQRAGTTFSNSSIDNDGLVSARADGLQFSGGGGGATSTGTWEAQAGDTLRLQGTFELSGGAMTGAGTVQIAATVNAAGTGVNPAVLDLNSGALTLTGVGTYAPQTLRLTGGSVSSTRNVAPSVLDAQSGGIAGAHTVDPGTFTKTTGGQLVLGAGTDVLLDAPTTHADGPICVLDGGQLRLRATYTFASSIATDTPLNCGPATGGVVVQTGGRLTRQAGGQNRFLNTRVDVAAGGAVDVPATTGLRFNGGLSLSGGSLTGGGTVTGAVTNPGGTVAPGSSPGTLTIDGPYTQGPGGTLAVELDGVAPGTGHDQLVVTGPAALDGTLAIDREPTFTPADGDVFTVLTAASRTGTFATVTGAAAGGGRTLNADYQPTSARLAVVLPAPPVAGTPAITGTPAPGQTLTCTPGTWTGAPSFAFAWTRNGAAIAGATASTYVVAAADRGAALRCVVTGTNAGGSATATSAPVNVPAPPPPPPPTTTTTTTTPPPPPPSPDPAPAPASAPPPPPATTATTPAAPVTAQAPSAREEQLAAASPATVATALALPSARRCVSRRAFPIRIRQPKGTRLASAVVKVAGRKVRVRRAGTGFTATVDLKGFSRGRFTVDITVKTRSGKALKARRAYRTCLPKRR